MKRSTLAPAALALLTTLGYVGEGISATTADSSPTTSLESTEPLDASTDNAVADSTSSPTALPIVAFVCGTAQKSTKSAQPTSSSVTIKVVGNDPMQTFTWGSKFSIDFSV